MALWASVSAMPLATFPTLLKVIGTTAIARARGGLGAPGARSCVCTEEPVTASSAGRSTHCSAAGVRITRGSHPARASSAATSGARLASGAPQTTRVQMGATPLLQQTRPLRQEAELLRLGAVPPRQHLPHDLL